MDKINLQILEDGTVTIKTNEISDGNHIAAENLLEELESMLGGSVTRQKNPDKKNHVHIQKKAFAY